MVVLEQLVELRVPAELRGVPSKALDAHIHKKILKPLSSTPHKTLAVGDDKAHPDLLEGLNPELDTLPYLFVLNSQAQAGVKKGAVSPSLSPGGALWDRARLFVDKFDTIEIRYAGQEWMTLLDTLSLVKPNSPQGDTALLNLMADAMARLDPSLGTFTTSHLVFLRKCLDTKSYAAALKVIQHDIHSFPPKTAPEDSLLCSTHYLSNGFITIESGLTAKFSLQDVQEYQMLCAMAYVGLRKWDEAKYHCEYIICTPTINTANGLMLEAYQKWLLLSLLVDGDVKSLPRSASGNAIKTMKAAAKPYEAIVEAFKQGDPAKLMAEFHEAQSSFDEDANVGLVQNVVSHHRSLYVARFPKMYSAMPVSKIAQDLGGMTDNEAERYLSTLINEGFLRAEIEAPTAGRSSVVRFLHDAEQGMDVVSEAKLHTRLLSQANRIRTLDKHVAEADYRLAVTKEYAEYERKARKAKQEQKEAGEAGEGNDDSPLPPGAGSDDEESMMVDAS